MPCTPTPFPRNSPVTSRKRGNERNTKASFGHLPFPQHLTHVPRRHHIGTCRIPWHMHVQHQEICQTKIGIAQAHNDPILPRLFGKFANVADETVFAVDAQCFAPPRFRKRAFFRHRMRLPALNGHTGSLRKSPHLIHGASF